MIHLFFSLSYVSVLESRLERLEGILKKQTKKTEKRQDAYKKLDQEKEKHPFFKGEHYISNHSIAWIFTNTIRSQAHQLGIQIHGGNHGDCYYVRALGAEKDRRPAQIEQLVELGIIKSDASITSVEDWILAVANVDKLTSDRLLEV
jgi:hypothetical protein